MSRTWKSVLYEYVQSCNHAEADYSLPLLLPFVSDEHYIAMQRERRQLLAQWQQERNTKLSHSETRMKINRLVEQDSQVITDIALRKQLRHQSSHVEERIEYERITLSKEGSHWTISRIEAAIPERRTTAPIITDREPMQLPSRNLSTAQAKSIPLLNQQLLSNRHPPHADRELRYNRLKAQQYADKWWNSYNPSYIPFEVDCTNYVSQCLYAGGMPMNYTGNRQSGWWYRGMQHKQEQWSFSWSVAHSLHWSLTRSQSGIRAEMVDSPKQLTIGDVIVYDWDGDSRYQHSTIVTAIDANGLPLVNAHTTNSRQRYWDYRDSYAWSEHTKFRLFHIVDP